MATTELSALRPPLLQLSALGTVPPPLALHYHPDPFLNSLYIGPAGAFGLFPSSRLKRRPSHCELELAEGEYDFVCTDSHLLGLLSAAGTHAGQPTRGLQYSGYTHVQNRRPAASPTQPQPPNQPPRVVAKCTMAWGPQDDSPH